MSLDLRIGDFEANITHNLATMWKEAGCYEALYGGKRVREVLPALVAALADMEARPRHYRKFDSPNGWATYDHALSWLKEVVDAARKRPNCLMRSSL